MNSSEYLTEYDGIVKTIQLYLDGSRQGKSELMRPAFHPDASFFGYAGGQLATGTPFLFDWIDGKGFRTAIRTSRSKRRHPRFHCRGPARGRRSVG